MPKGTPHTFESANAKIKVLGNRIIKSTFKGWSKPCTIIFLDKTVSEEHSPRRVYGKGYKSKPREHIGEHTFESANAKMQELGNRIVESTFNGWGKPCTIIFADGTESTKHSPYEVDRDGWKSKPELGKHTFETANAEMGLLGNRIVKSTFKGWQEPCTIIFADGTESTEHTPYEVCRIGYKSKPMPRGRIPFTFESANAKMQELENRIVECTFKGWQEPCTIIFADGTESTEHTPYEVDQFGYTSKPGIREHTFETANAAMNSLGNSIVESTFISWTKPCTIIFSDKTESNEHSPREVHSSLYKSKPAKNSFDVNKPGYIYFFAYKVYGKTVAYKIGITNNRMTTRFSYVNNKLKDKSRGSLKHCDALFYFHDGHKCLDAETIIKRKFERIIIDNVVDGKDEMFSKEGALIAYLFTKMLKCCKEISSKSKRHEVQKLVKYIAKCK